jgi:hypothetical protein
MGGTGFEPVTPSVSFRWRISQKHELFSGFTAFYVRLRLLQGIASECRFLHGYQVVSASVLLQAGSGKSGG